MNKDNKKELFPIVDAAGNVLGSISRGEAHNGGKVLHPVVHLHLFNSKGELFLQNARNGRTYSPANGTRHVADILTTGRLRKRLCCVKCVRNWA